MNYTQKTHDQTRAYLKQWQADCAKNFYTIDTDFQHSIKFYFAEHESLEQELQIFAEKLATEAEPLVAENYFRLNYPRLEKYSGIGQDIEHIQHHPNYEKVGNIIYGSKLLQKLSRSGGMLESLSFFFLSGQLGEAGHNCPFACSAGIVRVLQKTHTIKDAGHYIEKLCTPSYTENYTGAQFLTEIQGGSDVGQNATLAKQDEQGQWRIRGEKWFCSNANAELLLMTARYDEKVSGTKGLGLFLVPKFLANGEHNHYSILRLKEKIGTNTMASGEIAFLDAIAFPVGEVKDGFKLVIENVLHVSRLCNSVCVLGMSRRAYHVAKFYAQYRIAFGQAIINYPLVQENLAIIKSEDDAALAASFASIHLQDQFDLGEKTDEKSVLLLRLRANLCKYITALWAVEHIHHAIDMLAGNGAIETFSPLPRLLRDSIVCENWEGTHNTLRMQIARDIEKFDIGQVLMDSLQEKTAQLKQDARQEILKNQLTVYVKKYLAYKAISPALKLLAIKDIVDQMCMMMLAVDLLLEAEHQSRTQGGANKFNSFDFFVMRHFEREVREYDDAYLGLIKKILA